MRLIDLSPNWVGAGGPGITTATGEPIPERHGIGVMFDCPCGCGQHCYVPFANPLDGGPPHEASRPLWTRAGETFKDLTVTPSILRARAKGGCGWHGFITRGDVTGQVEG